PENIKQHLDLNTLSVSSESFVNDELKEHFSDLILEIKTKDNYPIDIALLFEHKSNPDKYTLVQVVYYMFAYWYKLLANNKKLKPIIPFVYFQGSADWKAPKLIELFPGLSDDIATFVPDFEHLFFKLNDLADAEIAQLKNGLLASALLAQKKALDPKKNNHL
ncbi:MAG: Rpn family recombination-promoting nuclease/putative transposase, partial [Cytophagales bacterium]